jgi:membrane protease YdiL (CAAX protease family)
MIVGVLLFYLVVRIAEGYQYAIDHIRGELIIQFLAFLPFLWLWYKQYQNEILLRHFFNKHIDPFRWYYLVMLWVVLLFFFYGLEGVITQLVSAWEPQYEVGDPPIFPEGQSLLYHTCIFFLAVFVAPVMEEFVFRGLILQRLMIKYGPSMAIILSSAVFGLLHFESWFGAMVFGIIMCLLFIQTQNLWVPIVIHVANNFIAVWINVIQQGKTVHKESQIVYYLLVLLLLPFIVYFIRKYWSKSESGLPYNWNLKQAA